MMLMSMSDINCALCGVDMPCAPLGEHDTRCDYLVFAEEGGGKGWKGWVVPLELKARLEIGKVTEQLQAGANAASRLVADASRIAFVPVVACGRSLN